MVGPSRILLTAPCFVALLTCTAVPGDGRAQVPESGEVRQLVTFSFLPGRSADALEIFRTRAVPLYEGNPAMLSFRGLREVESPVPLNLVVVSAFHRMAGMDDSNDRLRALAAERGSSIGAIYGAISELSTGHTDQFVEMLPELGTGDPATRRLTALISYRVAPGAAHDFERLVAEALVPLEAAAGVPASTGRFLVSDGWTHLRFVGFDSLGGFQSYWERLRGHGVGGALDALTLERREVILAGVPELAVR